MALLNDAVGPGTSICLLGAGQLNDVRLDELLQRSSSVTLVDVDAATVESALTRHGIPRSLRCRLHPPVDLSGVLDVLPAAGSPVGGVTEGLLSHLAGHRCHIDGAPCDVTASLGVLTQLLQSVVDSALSGPSAARVSVALRDKHLRDLVRLTRPGGTALLVTDVVSTTTAPELVDADPRNLEPHMAALVAAGNFFTGTNPYRIVAVLEEDAHLSALVAGAHIADPWLWAVTPDRQHLTCAIVIRRRPAAAGPPA
jgi:hypothetical protein